MKTVHTISRNGTPFVYRCSEEHYGMIIEFNSVLYHVILVETQLNAIVESMNSHEQLQYTLERLGV